MRNLPKNFGLCGNCEKCCNPTCNKVRLTPRDVFSIAYELKLSPAAIINSYCEFVNDGQFPKVYLLKELEECVFKQNTTCKLTKKPDVCIAFPYGGTLWFNEPYENVIFECELRTDITKDEVDTFVGDILFEKYKTKYSKDIFLQKWRQTLSVCSMLISGIEKESDRLEATKLALHYLYEKYNTEKFFMAQFDKNVLNLIKEIG